jgi:lincosamide nucleotidyltransferase A/C/D/E
VQRIWVAHFFSHFGASRDELRRFERALFVAGFGRDGELGYEEEVEGDGNFHHWTHTATDDVPEGLAELDGLARQLSEDHGVRYDGYHVERDADGTPSDYTGHWSPRTLGGAEVSQILDRLDEAGIWYCVEGGWGVDALLGERTRVHEDLDLGVRLEDVDRICGMLWEYVRDDAEWPSSVVLLDSRGRKVDAHPLRFDENGDGWQANLAGGDPYRWPREHLDARGLIARTKVEPPREVRCITPELQLRWHDFDEADDVDWQDVRALCERFALTPPPRLAERPGFVHEKRKRLG